jgi:hypothetical protein
VFNAADALIFVFVFSFGQHSSRSPNAMNWKKAFEYGLCASLNPFEADTPPQLLRTVFATSSLYPSHSSFPYFVTWEIDDHIRVYELSTLTKIHDVNCTDSFPLLNPLLLSEVVVDPASPSTVALLFNGSRVVIIDLDTCLVEFQYDTDPASDTVAHLTLSHGFLVLIVRDASRKTRKWIVYIKTPSEKEKWKCLEANTLPGGHLFNLGRFPLIFVPLPAPSTAMVLLHCLEGLSTSGGAKSSTVFHSAFILTPQGISEEKFRIQAVIDWADVSLGDETIRLWRFTRYNFRLLYSVITFSGRLLYQASWNCMNCDVHVKQRTSHGLFMTSKFPTLLVTPNCMRIHSLRRAPGPQGEMSRVFRSIDLPNRKHIAMLSNAAPGRFVAVVHLDETPEEGESVELRLYKF